MSHQAYTWVLQKGPGLKTVGRKGKPYGVRARAMRAVLASIANAASATGENSHPGLAAMIEESLYGKSHVLRIVDELVAEGWLEVTEEGRGRGHATVYRICMERGKVPPGDVSENGKGPIPGDKRSHPKAEKVPSEAGAPLFPNDSTGNNGSASGGKSSLDEHAHRLAVLAFEQPVKPTIAGDKGKAFVAVLGLLRAALAAGRSVQVLEGAIVAGVDVWTTQGLNTAVAKQRNGRAPRTPIVEHMTTEFDEAGGLK